MKKSLAIAAVSFLFAGCLGYHIGPVKPQYLRSVHNLAVPNFQNKTLSPQVEVLITTTVIKQFQQDGTYRITEENAADATLKGEIIQITRSPARSVRGNVLATTEFDLTVTVRFSVVSSTGAVLSAKRDVSGTTSFFVSSDVATDERQALPLAAEELAKRLVAELSEGW